MMIRQMVICTIDHTDGDLHIWEHLELELKSKLKSELKLSNMFAYGRIISLHSSLLGLTIDWKIEDSVGS